MVKLEGRKVWVAGSRGMVGAAITRRLASENCGIIPDPTKAQLDLRRQSDVEAWMTVNKPEVVFIAAARVGGIMANATYPADFVADNLQIETNIITTAQKLGVERLVFLGSSCIYPKHAPQPLREEYLLTGPLEETNRAYAIAKLAGLELTRAMRVQHGCNFVSVLPCNLYGPGDTYDAERSHVIPALILKIKAAIDTGADEITIWGTGTPLREFMHADDCADAIVHVAKHYEGEGPVNIGTGTDISISDLVSLLCDIAKFKGRIIYDPSKPDGTPRKLLDITRLQAASWIPKIPLQQGLAQVWKAFCQL